MTKHCRMPSCPKSYAWALRDSTVNLRKKVRVADLRHRPSERGKLAELGTGCSPDHRPDFTVNLRRLLRHSGPKTDVSKSNQPRHPVLDTRLGFSSLRMSQAPCQARDDGFVLRSALSASTGEPMLQTHESSHRNAATLLRRIHCELGRISAGSSAFLDWFTTQGTTGCG